MWCPICWCRNISHGRDGPAAEVDQKPFFAAACSVLQADRHDGMGEAWQARCTISRCVERLGAVLPRIDQLDKKFTKDMKNSAVSETTVTNGTRCSTKSARDSSMSQASSHRTAQIRAACVGHAARRKAATHHHFCDQVGPVRRTPRRGPGHRQSQSGQGGCTAHADRCSDTQLHQ